MESVTALYAGLSGVLFAALSLNVSRVRHAVNPAFGDTSNPDLQRAIRAHGNCAEYLAWLFVLLFLAEASGGGSMLLHVFGGLVFAARVVHAAGMLGKIGALTATGATLNYTALFGLAVYVLYLRFT